jgi:para-aminobenzoate synthetase component 1
MTPGAGLSWKKISWIGEPWEFYLQFKGSTPSVLLESAREESRTGRYSIVAKNPFLILEYRNECTTIHESAAKTFKTSSENPFKLLKKFLKQYALEPMPEWPPFATGAIGYAGYECQKLVEPYAGLKADKVRSLPDLYFLFFDRCVVWDHVKHEIFLAVRGLPAELKRFEKEVRGAFSCGSTNGAPKKTREIRTSGMKLDCSFAESDFVKAVNRTKQYIREGEIFQANLAQRFSFSMKKRPETIYAALRRINPSPFFGVFDAKKFQIVSGSPERLLKLENRQLETRPIAGTRRRSQNAREDARLSRDLFLSEKERAEHVMLVDLERNDMGRVSEYGSVSVDEFMVLENYSHVKHIVSNVRGILKKGLDGVDAFQASFPGGTITGAPKIRCMQIIEELEPVARGPYTGSLGYFSFSGNMDFNILIRSLVIQSQRASLHVGAGIVADSEPRSEYHETLYKAEAVFSAVFGPQSAREFLQNRGAHARLS